MPALCTVWGMLIRWKTESYSLLSLEYDLYSISAKFYSKSEATKWWLSGFTGHQYLRGREELWTEYIWFGVPHGWNLVCRRWILKKFCLRTDWADKNRYRYEKTLRMGNWRWFIGNNVVEWGFTWSNLRENPSCSWHSKLVPKANQRFLPRRVSDHCSILLDIQPPRDGSSPFRFQIIKP